MGAIMDLVGQGRARLPPRVFTSLHGHGRFASPEDAGIAVGKLTVLTVNRVFQARVNFTNFATGPGQASSSARTNAAPKVRIMPTE